MRHGMQVKVPKGTSISTTHPIRTRIAKRDSVVTVHHTLPAERIILATRYPDRLFFEGGTRQQIALCQRLGLPHRTDAEIQTSLESLLPATVAEPVTPMSSVAYLMLEIRPAMVCWAGSGGYWCEVPQTAVVEVG